MKQLFRLLIALIYLCGLAIPSAPAAMAQYEPPELTSPAGANAPDNTITVNSTLDNQANDGACTLREAILNANADDQSGSPDCVPGSGADIIQFNLTYPAVITLGSTLPVITSQITIQGPGPGQLILNGNNAVSVFIVPEGGALTLGSLTVANGKSSSCGGGISNAGALSVINSVIRNNTAACSGGIDNFGGSVAVINSTFSGNQTSKAAGAIGNYGGTLNILNSTFYDNHDTGSFGGGAIYNTTFTAAALNGLESDRAEIEGSGNAPSAPGVASVSIIAATFASNTAASGGGAIGNGSSSTLGGTVAMTNTLFADNTVGVDIVSCFKNEGTIRDAGYNMEDGDTCGFSGASIKNTDPLLLQAQSITNSAPFLPLRYDSPAINFIPSGVNGCGTTVKTDQREINRPVGAGCEPGAYEFDQQAGPGFIVNQDQDDAGVCGEGYCTLRQAMTSAMISPAGTYTITFDLAYPTTITLTSALPSIAGNLTIQGPGAQDLILDGNHAVRPFYVGASASLNLSGVSVNHGSTYWEGGAIENHGSLHVTGSSFKENVSHNWDSGAILNHGGISTITSSTFISNTTKTAGGAIGVYGGSVSITNTTFYGNQAQGNWGGGAIYVKSSGAILSLPQSGPSSNAPEGVESPAAPQAATLIVVNSTFANNTAPGSGAAIGNGGWAETGGNTTLSNNLLATNKVGANTVNCFNNAGTLTDGGYNLEDGNTCGFSGTSLINTNPKLLPLASFADTPAVLPLRNDSPAINRIPSGVNGCGTTIQVDERGITRPVGPGCEVGAFEFEQVFGPSFVVNQTADDGGVCGEDYCTLRQAMTSAMMSPAGTYTITFKLTYPATITLTGVLPDITKNLTIQGPGANNLAIDGNQQWYHFQVATMGSLNLLGLTLSRGSNWAGGSVVNHGTLNINSSLFIANTSRTASGAIMNWEGTSSIDSSTFSRNTAVTAGGAIGVYGGTVTVTNSTFDGNKANGTWGGGAIYIHPLTLALENIQSGPSSYAAEGADAPTAPQAATLTIESSTFANNTAPGGGGAIANGGFTEVGGNVTLTNLLLGGNKGGAVSINCSNNNGTLTDGGYNLEDADTCGFSGTSLKNTTPLLLTPADNGGGTPTIALESSSPAIDQIPSGANGCGTTLTVDQRGVARPQNGKCDVGALEMDLQPLTSLIVNKVADDDGLCWQSYCTLRRAISTANAAPAGSYTITFDLPFPATILLSDDLPDIGTDHTITIQGPGARNLSIDGNHSAQPFFIPAGAVLNLVAVSVNNGKAVGGSIDHSNGGAIANRGTLNVTSSAFSNNFGSATSGAITNFSGIVTISASTFYSNTALNGGGAISNVSGLLTVINSTFSNNKTGTGGGGAIININTVVAQSAFTNSPSIFGDPGLPLTSENPEAAGTPVVKVIASTFYGNLAAGGGGAIGNGTGGVFYFKGGQVTITNTLMAGNLVGTASVNCFNKDDTSTISDGGYNLEDADTCGFSGTSLKNTNPLALILADNGGPTHTIALQPASPALDRIPMGVNGCGTTLTTDQRGQLRPFGAGCDIGAYERFYVIWIYMPLVIQ